MLLIHWYKRWPVVLKIYIKGPLFSIFVSCWQKFFSSTIFYLINLTLYYNTQNKRHRRREANGPKPFCMHLKLTPRSLVWKKRYWDTSQRKVVAFHSHKFTHVMHTLLIRSRTLRIRYSYARICYAYVTHTLTYVIHALLIRLYTQRIRWYTLQWLTVVDSSGSNTQKLCV